MIRPFVFKSISIYIKYIWIVYYAISEFNLQLLEVYVSNPVWMSVQYDLLIHSILIKLHWISVSDFIFGDDHWIFCGLQISLINKHSNLHLIAKNM